MARTLYRGGYLLTLDRADTAFERGDLLVEDKRTAAVGPEGSVDPTRVDRVVPSEHLLFFPGMVNAHTHCNAHLGQGPVPGSASRALATVPAGLEPRARRRGTLPRRDVGPPGAAANGTTRTVDHFLIDPQAEHFGAPSLVRAIRDSGIRGVLACNVSDVPYEETVPIGDDLSADTRAEVARVTAAEAHSSVHGTAAAQTILEAAEAFVRALHDPSARVICQLTGVRALADRLGVGIHIHVLESKTQGLGRRGLRLDWHALTTTEPVATDRALRTRLERAADALGFSARVMVSGAGHDSMAIASRCPVAMIFTPCRGGFSHRRDEFADEPMIDPGFAVLKRILADLAWD
jgi:cytosine/adenosine deaminase-related metal-dependent hydrolase